MTEDKFNEFCTRLLSSELNGCLVENQPEWEIYQSLDNKYKKELENFLIRLNLQIDEDKDYLRLVTREPNLPKVTRKTPFSFIQSAILVLLREEWHKYELEREDSQPLYLKENDILEKVDVFMKEFKNKYRGINMARESLKKIDLPCIKCKNNIYTILPTIKAYIDIDQLNTFKARLQENLNESEEI